MSQCLVLPLRDARITAGYKSPQYRDYWGFAHYGVDCVSPSGRQVAACGRGEVVAAGQDGPEPTGPRSRLGRVLVVVYPQALCRAGKARDLTCRMYHLDSIAVKPGDRVEAGDLLGMYGNTGANTTGPHLHVEFDADTRFPCLAYGVSAGGQVINRAEQVAAQGLVDSTLDPAAVWRLGPEQSLQGAQGGWFQPSDLALTPLATGPSLEDAEALALLAKADQAVERLAAQWKEVSDGLRKLWS